MEAFSFDGWRYETFECGHEYKPSLPEDAGLADRIANGDPLPKAGDLSVCALCFHHLMPGGD